MTYKIKYNVRHALPLKTMRKRLTLRMEKDLIDYAKVYAKEHGTSVSKMVANYFAAVAAKEKNIPPEDEDFGPITHSLGAEPTQEVTEEDYYRYLEEKHR